MSDDGTSHGNGIILDEEFVAFKVNPDIYSAFYLGYLLGRVNADMQHNYTEISKELINSNTKRSHDIVRYIDETWEIDHLQNVEAMRHGYSATIRYQGLTLYCSLVDVSSINRILAAMNDVRTIYQLRTVFTTNGYVMVKMSYNNYIIMSDTAYHQHLIDKP